MNEIKECAARIREILLSQGIKTEQIYLFGSRARNSNDDKSDYDLLVLTETELNNLRRRALKAEIARYLFKNNSLLPKEF